MKAVFEKKRIIVVMMTSYGVFYSSILSLCLQVYKCLSCDYLFGNLSDLKRHLKIRHRVQGQDMANLDQLQISEVQVKSG